MEESLDYRFAVDTLGEYALLMGIAYLLALPIAFNRERKARSAGMRTFPLVAIAACAYMLTARSVLQGSDAQARVMYGLITGMGFIGGGAVVQKKSIVDGTATAASLWLTGAIGMAVAYKQYPIAILLSIVTYLTLSFGQNAKEKIDELDGSK